MNSKPSKKWRFFKIVFYLSLIGGVFGALGVGVLYLVITPNLPPIDSLKDIQLQEPLRVYSRDGLLMAEFGEKRRIPLAIDEIPQGLKDAVIAAEDDRFEVHPGVDYQGLLRAGFYFITTGTKSQGGSTITMQVARNFFLSREKTFLRKFNEIFLALRIEEELSKDKILELYLNKIYLGKRAYGVASAAQVYYGKTVDELTLAQMAMVAGLPKAPSKFNPVVNPDRAMTRRNYVLGRMLALGKIDQAAYDEAIIAPITSSTHEIQLELEAPYAAEMVRSFVIERYGDEAYTSGMKIYTTIDSRLQDTAQTALRNGLLDYEERHGYRGVIKTVSDTETLNQRFYQLSAPDQNAEVALPVIDGDEPTDTPLDIDEQLAALGRPGGLIPAAVADVGDQTAGLYLGDGKITLLSWEGMSWARKFITVDQRGAEPKTASDILQAGDIVWVRQHEDRHYSLSQIPQVEGAFISLDPKDGGLLAVVGGFDFSQSKFNRVMQAKRQPGSNFKPFIYSAALANGYTPASIFNDAPVVFDDPALEDRWRPENYSSRFFGPTRLHQALIKSRNLVSIRILLALGISKAQRYARQFGFTDESLPRDLSLALGSGTLTPLELARGFSVFANGGYLVTPHFVDKILDGKDKTIYFSDHVAVCETCEEEVEGLESEAVNADETNTETQTDTAEVIAVEAAKSEENDNTVPVVEESVEETDEQVALAESELNATPEEAMLIRLPPPPAERVMDVRTNFLINSLLRDVIKNGTGVRARVLGRHDLAGKTGTTNDQHDAWFSGFYPNMVATVWVGYDNHKPLGSGEAGARAALPIWIDYMRTALKDQPEVPLIQPEGLVTVRIDPETGLLADSQDPDAIFETFRVENVPTQKAAKAAAPVENTEQPGEINTTTESELF